MDDSERVLCEDYHRRKKDFYRLRNHKISEYTHRFIINGREICKPSTSVVLLVHSLHSYSDRRDAIRRTWGGASHHVQLVFVFGAHPDKRENDRVLVESSDYGDIIQGDFHESYRNMTLKSLLGLKWVHEYCPSAKYIIKSDDDMVVNIPTLLKVIHKRGMSWAMMGPYNGRSRVYRAGKWRLRWEDFPFYFYPPYESGSCYVITADLAFPLFEAAEYVPHLFIDDVFITGILGSILNVTHIKQDGFAFWTNKKPQMCEIATNQIITGTKMTPTFMMSFWSDLKRYGPKCTANPDKDLLHPKNVTNKLK
ncbi:hypothetical protein CAPTEDRAFT_184731 [Capitella teleta]|uniref:Hexosyltransferase n=1 Tax=Capitella teleta TaxID=283909 RepID=R7TY83_CAPTE|nr:hypothetical protein CAPTEDRAFT_184731 [Capitella teleta]|eukprot:ELT96381.1 hypothetical protein CAPTEDRAFT_184731 [Capitella teleta]